MQSLLKDDGEMDAKDLTDAQIIQSLTGGDADQDPEVVKAVIELAKRLIDAQQEPMPTGQAFLDRYFTPGLISPAGNWPFRSWSEWRATRRAGGRAR